MEVQRRGNRGEKDVERRNSVATKRRLEELRGDKEEGSGQVSRGQGSVEQRGGAPRAEGAGRRLCAREWRETSTGVERESGCACRG